MSHFRKELETLINKHSKENTSQTPDFILADYLENCLMAFDNAVSEHNAWYMGQTKEIIDKLHQ